MAGRKKAWRSGPGTRPPSRLYRERLVTGAVALFLVVIVWIVFGQTLGHDFVNYDDSEYVRENSRIVSGLSLGGIQWAFSHVHAGNWHPLTTISHMLDCQLYGLGSWGHHLTNVLLHAVAAVLLFLALRQLTGALWLSAFVAAVFAIHPLRVESVAWISERKDVLSGVFFMLILWAYAWYARSPRPSPGRYLMVVVLFAMGLMCKPTLVTLPFVLLLLDYWPLRRFAMRPPSKIPQSAPNPRAGQPSGGGAPRTKPFGDLLIEKIPFFLLSAASCVATLLAQERAVITLRQLTVGDRLANAVVSYVAYLGQLIWPSNLAVVYAYPQGGWSTIQTILALLVLVITSVAFFAWRVKYPFLLVGWLWFLGMLIPMIGIVQVGMQTRADRYTYLTQIGLCLLVTWGATELFGKWRRGRAISIALGVLIVTGLMANAYSQASFWRDSETLWNRTLAKTSNNYIAQTQLADELMKKGRLDEAISYLRQALTISDYPTAHYNLGYALANKGDWTEAIAAFQNAIRFRPNYPQAHSNLAVSFSKLGQNDEALAEFQEALRIDNNYRDAHYNLAILLLQLGRREEAVIHFREALRLKPDDTAVREQLRQLGAEN